MEVHHPNRNSRKRYERIIKSSEINQEDFLELKDMSFQTERSNTKDNE